MACCRLRSRSLATAAPTLPLQLLRIGAKNMHRISRLSYGAREAG